MPRETERTRSEHIEVQATPEERALIDQAVAALDTDLTSFVIGNLTIAARRTLADRRNFVLDTHEQSAWEEINSRPTRDIAGLRALLERRSPFIDM